MVTRRALLGAGAIALLAGCGPAEEPEIVPEEVLGEQLRLSIAVVAAYEGVAGADALRQNAQRRVNRLDAALEDLGAEPGASSQRAAATGPGAALAAEGAALRAHVAAVGLLGERRWRELLAGLIADAATGESALRVRLRRRDVTSSFPGEPLR